MNYYSVEDIQRITGTSYSKSCEIIRNLNEKYKQDYPSSEIIRGKILKKYFDIAQGIDEGVDEQEIEK